MIKKKVNRLCENPVQIARKYCVNHFFLFIFAFRVMEIYVITDGYVLLSEMFLFHADLCISSIYFRFGRSPIKRQTLKQVESVHWAVFFLYRQTREIKENNTIKNNDRKLIEYFSLKNWPISFLRIVGEVARTQCHQLSAITFAAQLAKPHRGSLCITVCTLPQPLWGEKTIMASSGQYLSYLTSPIS